MIFDTNIKGLGYNPYDDDKVDNGYPDSENGYSQLEELEREKYYENKYGC